MKITTSSYVGTIWIAAALTLLLGAGEALYGYVSGSSYVLKDGAEWGYALAIYVASASTYGRTPKGELRAAVFIAVVLLIGGCQGAFELISRFHDAAPERLRDVATSSAISLLGALLVAGLLFRFRSSHDPVVEGSWLVARNDLFTSGLDAAITLISALVPAQWPQMVVDGVGVLLAFQAAFVVGRDALDFRRANPPASSL